MLVKFGVDYTKLERPMCRALNVIDEVFIREVDEEAVLSSTYEGDHQPGSLHYRHLACDFRLKHYSITKRDDLKLVVKKALNDRFGKFQYDVLFSAGDTVLHVEYDPK